MTPPAIQSSLEQLVTRLVVPPPAGPEAPVATITIADHTKRGSDIEVTIPPEHLTELVTLISTGGYMLESITGVDWIANQQYEVIYDFTLWQDGTRITVRTFVPRTAPEVPSLCPIYPGANWHERETHDFFGIVFSGHPDLIPLLLPEDADFHPLRKDFGT